jgi:type IV fimbrial biogenesis protein FimT
VVLAANLSIESTMEKNLPLRRIPWMPRLSGQSGFTLIELLVTVSIAAVVLTIAIPNFIAFVQNTRITSQANDMVTSLNYARSEAIKRGIRTTVCSSATGTSCAASTTWETGWLVFVDCNNNNTADPALAVCPDWDADGAADGEPILQVRQVLEGGNTLRTGVVQRVTYQTTGFSNSGDTFRLCDTRGTASARAIVVSLQGRVATNPVTAQCP